MEKLIDHIEFLVDPGQMKFRTNEVSKAIEDYRKEGDQISNSLKGGDTE